MFWLVPAPTEKGVSPRDPQPDSSTAGSHCRLHRQHRSTGQMSVRPQSRVPAEGLPLGGGRCPASSEQTRDRFCRTRPLM